MTFDALQVQLGTGVSTSAATKLNAMDNLATGIIKVLNRVSRSEPVSAACCNPNQP